MKYKGGGVTPFAQIMMSVAESMLEIYSDRLQAAGEKGLVCFVGKRPGRICNLQPLINHEPLIACAFLGSDVKWVFSDDSDCCRGDGCPTMGRTAGQLSVFGGTGRTMLEWVLATPGFLEQVIRNEQVRRDIRQRIKTWH
jgi:hypothetical protein